jgi:hypothetical protein
MRLRDLSPEITINETLKKVDGRWALVSKSNPDKVLQYYHGAKDERPSKAWVNKVERRVHSFESFVINEGGNAFKDPVTKAPLTKQDATTDEVHAAVKALEKRLGIELFKNLTGSAIYAGKTTGDGDVNLDPTDFIEVDPNEPAKTTQNKFREWLTGQLKRAGFKDDEFKKGGDGLTVKAPIPGSTDFLQIDLDIAEPGEGKFSRWARRGEPGKAKGAFRHILKSAIARAINPNWKWSFKNGLFDDETQTTLSKDPDQIAKYFFGKGGKGTDLDNIDTILAKLKATRPGIYQDVVDKANAGIANMKYDYKLGAE